MSGREFTDAASLRPLVSEALADWCRQHHSAAVSYRDPETDPSIPRSATRIRVEWATWLDSPAPEMA
jgi:hypothetical protein